MLQTEEGHTTGGLRRILAAVCHACPACRYGRGHPDSLLGRLLHHPLHADRCPLWRAERAVYGSEETDGRAEPAGSARGAGTGRPTADGPGQH